MLYLITNPDNDYYALLESANNDGIITHVYRNTMTNNTCNTWTYDIAFSQYVRSELTTQRPLSDYLIGGYKTLFEATSMQELMELIDRHPEVFI